MHIYLWTIFLTSYKICFRLLPCLIHHSPPPLQDTESAAPPPPPRPPLPPRPAGLGPSYNAPNTAATKAGAGSDDAAGALVAEKVKGGRGDSVDGPSGGGGGSSSGLGSEEEAEVVEEFPLPELYVPGRIVHIYR